MQSDEEEEEKVNKDISKTRVGEIDKSSIDQVGIMSKSNFDQPSLDEDLGTGGYSKVQDNFSNFNTEKRGMGMAAHNRENSFKDIADINNQGKPGIHDSAGASSLDSPDVRKGLID